MIYSPINCSASRLLEQCGFRRWNKAGEFVRPEINKNRKTPPNHETLIRRRYHAFIYGNEIDFHYDMPKRSKKHQAQNNPYGKGGSRVRKMLNELKAKDLLASLPAVRNETEV